MNLNSSFPDTKMYKDQKIMISKLSVVDVIFHSRVYEKVAIRCKAYVPAFEIQKYIFFGHI